MEPLKVFLATPVNRDFPWQTTMSLCQTIAVLHDRRIPYEHKFNVGGSIVPMARNKLATLFLKGTCNRLFWLDSDMSWAPEQFLRVLSLTNAYEIVGASYSVKSEPLTVLTDMPDAVDGKRTLKANAHGLLEMKGFGLGFTCVQRSVMEWLAKDAPLLMDDDGEEYYGIFRLTQEHKKPFVGEDINFFRDARAAGYSVWMDPAIELGHVGAKEYRASFLSVLEGGERDGTVKRIKANGLAR